MAFNPSSTIYLCNVDFDSTYQHEVFFKTQTLQRSYFANRVVKTFSNYLTVRTTRPDGSLQSSVKVNANIDELRSLPCNYMYYQNAHHGTRFFYAFITKLIYINEATTEIVFETDVYQTWLFDVTLKPSYVVREHSKTDEIGDNLVPESFNFQDYVYQTAKEDTSLNEWGYLVATTDHNLTDPSLWEELFGGGNVVINGRNMSGIYQGLFFYYYHDVENLNAFLNEIVERNGDCVVFIALIPKFNVSGHVIGATDADNARGEGWIYGTNKPSEKTISILTAARGGNLDGYEPVNQKLLTSPFYKLVVSNHNGDQAEYSLEDFADPDIVEFTLYGDVSANPSVTLIPLNYRGISHNYDSGISISGFPQVSFNTDTFKLWLAKNQYGLALDVVGGLAQAAVGGAAAGPAGIVSGVTGILGTINTVYQQSREPNKAHTGGAKTNLLTAIKENKFDYYIRTIRKEHAKTVDDFFTMYGYQTNEVKIPNVDSRPYFNYVQTVDVNIVGGIPSEDMKALKAIYNKGVTLWKSVATIGDYTVNNSPR